MAWARGPVSIGRFAALHRRRGRGVTKRSADYRSNRRDRVAAPMPNDVKRRPAREEGPYQFLDWDITYGNISPLGISQQQCKNSWQDGVSGTNCTIPPGQNFTYRMQAKDQIGSFYYFPSLAFHKAAGGFGAIRIYSRTVVPIPFPPPADEYTVLIGDWYATNHKSLQDMLDSEKELPPPDGILINGKGSADGVAFAVEQGKTYRLRISNVGLQNTLNIRIQEHNMTLVEVEGTHTVQNTYSSLDVHVGQSLSVLFTADRPAKDYHIVVSTRFTNATLLSTAVVRYARSSGAASGPLSARPSDVDFSLNQARSISSASGRRSQNEPDGERAKAEPPGLVPLRLHQRDAHHPVGQLGRLVDGKRRYAVNGVSFAEADTPLKLADYYNISGVFRLGGIPDAPPPANGTGAAEEVQNETAVMDSDRRSFVEVVLDNGEDCVQTWHLDGYSVFVVGMDVGTWSEKSRDGYNLVDAVSRCTVQVYPRGWTAVLIALDNVGMWNMRSEVWARRYLGQQFYLRMYTPSHSFRDELPIPDNALLCGRAAATNSSSRLPLQRRY
ncbi:unnamed protein product [Miscanthus lutarioriparius]|uniref:L-ascorbate oxidase n=1 Tax=Miscanthus lutarioriparius TaxID=422564 RepID=A0A811QLW9_9POAL|nr:unnamed protein product [Miscanthus lutarioriparius]